MKLLHLAALLAALSAAPVYADKDLLGRDVPEKKHQKQTPPPVLPGLSGDVKASTDPQNSAEADTNASVKAQPPAADAAMFERQSKTTGGKPPAVEDKPEDAPKKPSDK